MKLSNKYYDLAKWVFLIVFPAISALIAGLGKTWGIENTEQIVTTINLIGVFGGTVLQVSSANYHSDN